MLHKRQDGDRNTSKRAARIVARSFYQELTKGGFGNREIMAVASELLGCLRDTMRASRG
jgi:hypothetical protein